MKATLVKTMLIPVLQYPTIPNCSASKTQKIKMQRILNKALRFIHCNDEEELLTEELHHKYNIAPLNISIFNSAQKTWEAIRITETELYAELTIPHNNTHNWFPKSSSVINCQPPIPIITS